MRFRILFVMASILCMGVTCGQQMNKPYSKTVVAGEAERITHAWFRCDECMNGELRRVQELGDTAVPFLANTFQGNVPDIANRVSAYEARCMRINSRIEARAAVGDTMKPAETCQQYGQRYQKQLINRYQNRSFEALLAIRTPDACGVIGMDYCENIPAFPNVRLLHETPRSIHHPEP